MKILSKIVSKLSCSKIRKRILIDAEGFKNRGDQLMIQSVLDQIRLHYPDSKVFLPKRAFLENPSYCMQNNIYPLRGNNKVWPYFRMLNILLRDEWFGTPNQIDVVFDCGGYHISDVFLGDESGAYYEQYYSKFSKRDRKIIFLPQAFGPFENAGSRKTMQLIYTLSSIIYARDVISKNYIESACGKSDKVKEGSDFTCLCKPSEHPPIQLSTKDYVLIIPNHNMLSKTEKVVADNYINFLISITQNLINKGEKVLLLNHEGGGDEQLLRQINDSLSSPLPILTNLRGQDIKEIIRNSKLTITARFHGAVSALTQRVPTLCVSWSHKYAELLKDHQCEQSMLNINNIDESLKTISDALANPQRYTSKPGCEEQIESDVNDMWEEVFNLV